MDDDVQVHEAGERLQRPGPHQAGHPGQAGGDQDRSGVCQGWEEARLLPIQRVPVPGRRG